MKHHKRDIMQGYSGLASTGQKFRSTRTFDIGPPSVQLGPTRYGDRSSIGPIGPASTLGFPVCFSILVERARKLIVFEFTITVGPSRVCCKYGCPCETSGTSTQECYRGGCADATSSVCRAAFGHFLNSLVTDIVIVMVKCALCVN